MVSPSASNKAPAMLTRELSKHNGFYSSKEFMPLE